MDSARGRVSSKSIVMPELIDINLLEKIKNTFLHPLAIAVILLKL